MSTLFLQLTQVLTSRIVGSTPGGAVFFFSMYNSSKTYRFSKAKCGPEIEVNF